MDTAADYSLRMSLNTLLPHRRAFVIVLLALSLTAATPPGGKPEDVGMSSERLQRINEVVKTYIDAGQISGAVTMVSRKGRIAHFEAQGLMDIDAKTPMRKDAIFRMASMSKPVTGVAILMLMEEGKLRLTDPVSRFIPEFKNTKVAMAEDRLPAAPARRRRRGQPPPRAGDLHRAGRARDHDPRSADAHLRARERRRRHRAKAAASRRATRASNLAALHPDSSAPCRSISSRARSGATARSPASKRSAASSRSRRGMTFDQFLQAAHLRSARHEGHGVLSRPTTACRASSRSTSRRPNGLSADRHAGLARDEDACSRAAAGCGPRPRTTCSSRRCSSTAAQLNGKRLLSPRTVDLMASNHVGDLVRRQSASGRRAWASA